MKKNEIKLIVKNLVEKYGTNDPEKLCKYLEIPVISWNFKTLKGFYKKIAGIQCICINQNLTKLMKKIVLSHELAHAILHGSGDEILMKDYFVLPKHDKFEMDANLFTARLIFSEETEKEVETEEEFATLEKLYEIDCLGE